MRSGNQFRGPRNRREDGSPSRWDQYVEPVGKEIDWDYWKEAGRPLVPKHPTIARESPPGMTSETGARFSRSVQMPHPLGKIPLDRLNHEVVVLSHQAVRVTNPIVALHYLRHSVHEPSPVYVILVDRFSPVATGREVIKGAGKLDS